MFIFRTYILTELKYVKKIPNTYSAGNWKVYHKYSRSHLIGTQIIDTIVLLLQNVSGQPGCILKHLKSFG